MFKAKKTIMYIDVKGVDDKVRVFIESNQKVMFVNTDEYKDAKNARAAYVNAITLIRAGGIVRATRSRNDLFLIRNDI